VTEVKAEASINDETVALHVGGGMAAWEKSVTWRGEPSKHCVRVSAKKQRQNSRISVINRAKQA